MNKVVARGGQQYPRFWRRNWRKQLAELKTRMDAELTKMQKEEQSDE